MAISGMGELLWHVSSGVGVSLWKAHSVAFASLDYLEGL